MKKYNAIDLFSGAGGLSYGFECAGFNILLGIDNDEKALETFELNHKNAKSICGDITEISYIEDIKPIIGDKKIDVIIGGPPCQGMSLSGPRQFDDPRNKLYLSYIRLVEEIRPDAFVIENVPGLVGLFGGQIKDSIIEKFSDLGYSIQYKILCAADYGVPQNRKRVIFVGTKKDSFSYPEPSDDIVTCEMALSDLPPLIDTLGEEEMAYICEPQNDYQRLMREYGLSAVQNTRDLDGSLQSLRSHQSHRTGRSMPKKQERPGFPSIIMGRHIFVMSKCISRCPRKSAKSFLNKKPSV